ncbi:hypothetical protein EPO05_06235 [Patescibacteria group bacterium]|nr:MAG: hypothetical protein EPO05_06235 [Patescibacteria group bacterium]
MTTVSGPPPMMGGPPPIQPMSRAKSGMPPPPPVEAGALASPTGTKATIVEPESIDFQPPRLKLDAVEGWGKTTIGAYSSGKPLIIMCGNETGYLTLAGGKLAPKVPYVHATSWLMFLDALDQALAIPGLGSVVIDATGGMERLAHEYVCNRDFKGDWGETGFMNFQKGYEISVAEILKALVKLDTIREKTKATVWLLGHVKTANIKNPMGPDYDQFTGDTHPKTMAIINKWCDAIFVGKYKTVVDPTDKKKTKGKGIGGTERVMYVDESDAVKAKNRYFMDTNPLPIPEDPTQSAAVIWAALTKHASSTPA